MDSPAASFSAEGMSGSPSLPPAGKGNQQDGAGPLLPWPARGPSSHGLHGSERDSGSLPWCKADANRNTVRAMLLLHEHESAAHGLHNHSMKVQGTPHAHVHSAVRATQSSPRGHTAGPGEQPCGSACKHVVWEQGRGLCHLL